MGANSSTWRCSCCSVWTSSRWEGSREGGGETSQSLGTSCRAMMRGSLVGPRGGPVQDRGVSHRWPAFVLGLLLLAVATVLGLLLLAVATVLGPSSGPGPGHSHPSLCGSWASRPSSPAFTGTSRPLPPLCRGREGLRDPNTTAGVWLCNQRAAQCSVSQAGLAAGIRGSPVSNADPQALPRGLRDPPPRGSSDWARREPWLIGSLLSTWKGGGQHSPLRPADSARQRPPPSPFDLGSESSSLRGAVRTGPALVSLP